MKISIVTTFYPGATIPLAHHLALAGDKVDYFFVSRQGAVNMETFDYDHPVSGSSIQNVSKENSIYDYLNKNVDIKIVPYYPVKNRKYLVGYIPFFRNLCIFDKLLKRINDGQYDLIYIIVNEEHDAIIARGMKRYGIKNVVIAYHEVVQNHIGKLTLKDCVKATYNLGYPLICYSEHTKKTLVELTGNNNVYVTYFGPFETYKRFDISKPIVGEPYVLFIGSIQPYKGLPFLYETIRDCGKIFRRKIVVAGSGYDKCIEEMQKDDRYILINRFLSDEEFANLTKFAECIVCPYVSGSQSGITHTAMVFGTPVIATKVGAFEEFVEEGKNGYLVDYGDKEGLMTAIEHGVTLRGASNTYIPSHLQWKNIVNKLKPLLKL